MHFYSQLMPVFVPVILWTVLTRSKFLQLSWIPKIRLKKVDTLAGDAIVPSGDLDLFAAR